MLRAETRSRNLRTAPQELRLKETVKHVKLRLTFELATSWSHLCVIYKISGKQSHDLRKFFLWSALYHGENQGGVQDAYEVNILFEKTILKTSIWYTNTVEYDPALKKKPATKPWKDMEKLQAGFTK